MADEIKFSKHVWLLARKNIDAIGGFFFFKFGIQVCLGVPSINLLGFFLKLPH